MVSRTDVRIEQASGFEDFQKIVDLQRLALDFEDIEIVPIHALHAISKSGGQVLAAFNTQGDALGFAFGLLAFEKEGGKRLLISNVVGVKPEQQCRGVGYALKQAQKKYALEAGISVIKWTYDPLISKNAYFNLKKLPARVYEFSPNQYGVMKSELYGNFPTDRFVVTWDLHDEQRPDFPNDALLLIEEGSGEPQVKRHLLSSGERYLVCPIPLNHLELRKNNPDLARAWQTAVRDSSMALLDGRYCVLGFRTNENHTRGEYLFQKIR